MEEEVQRWTAAVAFRLSHTWPGLDLRGVIRRTLRRSKGLLAGGFVARCLMQNQLVASRFLSKPAYNSDEVPRLFSCNPDLDVYVPAEKTSRFLRHLSKEQGYPVRCQTHLAMPAYEESFMRQNGIVCRTRVCIFGQVFVDVMSCARSVALVVRNFDLTGCSVAWDGLSLLTTPTTPQDMRVRRQHGWPQFVWRLNDEYVPALLANNVALHKRVRKYAALGVHVQYHAWKVPSRCIAAPVAISGASCRYCESTATYGKWGQGTAQVCARHSSGDMHPIRNWFAASRLVNAVHRLCSKDPQSGPDYRLLLSAPADVFDLPERVRTVGKAQAVLRLLYGEDAELLTSICRYLKGWWPETARLLAEDGPGPRSSYGLTRIGPIKGVLREHQRLARRDPDQRVILRLNRYSACWASLASAGKMRGGDGRVAVRIQGIDLRLQKREWCAAVRAVALYGGCLLCATREGGVTARRNHDARPSHGVSESGRRRFVRRLLRRIKEPSLHLAFLRFCSC